MNHSLKITYTALVGTIILITSTLTLAGPFAAPEPLPAPSSTFTNSPITSLLSAPRTTNGSNHLFATSHQADAIYYATTPLESTSWTTIPETIRGPEAFHAIDITGDGLKDLIISSRWDRTIHLLINDGSGSFAPPTTIATEIDTAVVITSADIDKDGKLDLIGISDFDQEVFWLRQTNNNTFAPKQILLDLPATPTKFEIQDLNADTHPDLIILQAGHLSIFTNDGNGNFTITGQLGSAVTSFKIIDLNGGAPDIITASSILNISQAHLNDNAASFSPPQLLSANTLNSEIIAASDLDLDSHIDLLFISFSNSSLHWMRGNGTSSFISKFPTLELQPGPYTSFIVDLDNDSDPELIYSSLHGHDLSISKGLAAEPYLFWSQTHNISANPEDDTNQDGISNLLHYATNTDPNAQGQIPHLKHGTGTEGLPSSIITPNNQFQFDFIRRSGSRPNNISYTVRTSVNLTQWNTVSLDASNSSITPIDHDWERVRHISTSPQTDKIFLKLQIQTTQP